MKSKSLAGRAALAVLLMIGFYVLAVVMIAGLLFIPYAEVAYANRFDLKIALGCVFGAGAIAWAILPRFDKFTAPGPLLTREGQPNLFDHLTDVARRTVQAMPKEVYLVPAMNAWVASRGGVMGFGSRRVMGLGLPLMQITSIPEFEAIVAHEFGHYHGGDTRLGPWIYKTRAAIGRTLSSLGDEGIIHLPFNWYGTFFLKITQAISRAQEFTADRLSATVVGAKPLIDGLKRVHGEGAAFDLYWQQEAIPVLRAGFHAPVLDGFTQFLEAPQIRDGVTKVLDRHMSDATADPMDSHPPLRERIAAIEDLSDSKISTDTRKAIELLGDLEACEKSLIGFLSASGDASSFAKIAWNETATKVYAPLWRQQAETLADLIGESRIENLPELVSEKKQELAQRIIGQNVQIPDDVLPDILNGPLGACVATAFIDGGWHAATDVGQPVSVRRGGHTLEPFAVVSQLLRDPSKAAEWRARMTTIGAADLRLGGA